MKLALVFPGQGSQRPGMLAALERYQEHAEVIEEAADCLGYDPRKHDDEASLRSTVHVQIGLLLCGTISARVLAKRGVLARIVAGHSVGAFSAAVASGALELDRALRGVHVRAEKMEQLFGSGYGMGVCIGVPVAQVRAFAADARARGLTVFVANVNASAQTAISGTLAGVEDVLARAREHGARRAERLPVAVPSHCPLLEPVALAVRAQLYHAEIRFPHATYVCGMTGRAATTAADILDDLCNGVAHEVRWYDCAQLIVEMGARLAVEAVPDHVLTDLFDGDRLRAIAFDGTRAETIVTLASRAGI